MKKIVILFILFQCLLQELAAQDKFVDSMINWANTNHKIDSQYIVTLHKISYRLSEKDVKTSYEYFKKTAYYSDSVNFIYGKALAQINLGILLSNSANFDASNDAYFKAIEYADKCGALRLEAISLNNVGENFRSLQDFAKSRQYSKQAIDINTTLKAWRGVAINYELLQQCDLEEKLYASAKNNLLLGMPFAMDSKDSYGRTALSWASGNGHEAVVKLLVEKGSELDSKDSNGQTALLWASENGREAVVKLLARRVPS